MPIDIFKVLKDLEMKSVGLDPQTNKIQEGYFVSFRTVGLPILKTDFDNPWSPLGGNILGDIETTLSKAVPKTDAADPKTAPKTGSSALDENVIFKAAIGKSQQSYLNSFLLTDDKLQLNNQWAVMPSSSKVSDSWWAVITGANGIPTTVVLDPALQQAYDASRALIEDKDGNPTPHYQAYRQFQDRYTDKVKAWHKAYAAAFTDPMKLQAWPVDGVTYEDDANQAMNEWVGLGFKEEIDNAFNILAAQGTDPAIALISRSKQRFTNSLNEFQSVGTIPYTIFLPNTWYDDQNDDGWTDYTSSDAHSEMHYQQSSTSYGGGGGFNVGFWSASAGFEHVEQQSSMDIQANDMEISFSYCAVDLKRPWLDTSLLNLKNWFLMGDYKKNCISDGTMSQSVPHDGTEPTFLPAVVTSLILIKNLSLSWSNWKQDWDQHSSTTSASVSVGYGPFSVNGHYSHHNEARNFTADSSGESLMVNGTQLIGYVSAINPPCPAVDSAQFLKKS